MFSLFLLIVICLVLAGLSLVVLFKNYKSLINLLFASWSFLVAVWFVITYLEDLQGFGTNTYLFLTRFDYFLASILAGMFVLIFLNFPEESKKKTSTTVVSAITAIITLLSISPVFVTDVKYDTAISSLHFITSSLEIPYLATIILLVSYGIFSLYSKFKKAKGLRRSQIQYVLVGASLTTVTVLLVDGIIPRFFDVGSDITRLGIYGGVFFVGFFSVAIIRHKLMDIRMVVARSVAYAILILLLAGFYAAAILAAQSLVFPNANYSPGYIALQIALAIIMAISFQPLHRWVTRVTDKIFFKNSYNKDDLLSELSNTLGSTIVLIELLYKVSDILTKEMKASRTLFALIKDDNRLYTVQANGYKETPDVDPRDVLHITKDGLMIADELEENSRHKSLLRQYNAALAIPLKTEKEVVGVLLLGEKSSGDMYSQQDLSVLEILAPEIAVAIENAKSYEEINRFNITLRQEVKRATYRLKEKNTQLMELDKAKDEFISMASHQLRTPLTAIKGYLSMLLEGDAGDIKVSQYDFINEAYSGANRMVGLINDLLNVSRMETGRFFLEPKEVDIERVVQEEVKQLTNAAKTKGLYLKIEAKGKVPHIWADETKIRQVVMNFMDNAIYYTNTGGVTVVLSHDKDNFIYEVHDTGIGVPKEQQAHMFEKFFRADNARTARPDGTGLGIYLAKRVVVDHGGQIVFNSTEGKGSIFGFKFPLKQKVETKKMSAPAPLPEIPMGPTPTATEVAAVTKPE